MLNDLKLNTFLKEYISQFTNFKTNGTPIPEDLLVNIFNELRVSQLYIPANIEEDNLIFEYIGFDDGLQLLPLFTDLDEFKKHTGEYIDVVNDFPFYVDLVLNENLDGIIINLEGDKFFLDTFLLKRIPDFDCDRGSVVPYTGEELKNISHDLSNDKLVEFISKSSNFNNSDELLKILYDAIFLVVVSSNEDLSQFACNGIIDKKDVFDLNLCCVDEGREKYVLVFSSIESIESSLDIKNSYYQIVFFNDLLPYILKEGINGLIIDVGSYDYYVSRNVLFEILNHDGVDDLKFSDAGKYIFTFE